MRVSCPALCIRRPTNTVRGTFPFLFRGRRQRAVHPSGYGGALVTPSLTLFQQPANLRGGVRPVAVDHFAPFRRAQAGRGPAASGRGGLAPPVRPARLSTRGFFSIERDFLCRTGFLFHRDARTCGANRRAPGRIPGLRCAPPAPQWTPPVRCTIAVQSPRLKRNVNSGKTTAAVHQTARLVGRDQAVRSRRRPSGRRRDRGC